jgi:ABC-type Zn uptake system ZnuABC Zn-binding protein ZnuA
MAAAVALVACGGSSGVDDRSSGRIAVTATTPVVADLVRNVGGERVDVRRLLPAGADPHEHEPRPSDAAAAARSAVVFRSGGDLDAWLAGVLPDDGNEVALLDALPHAERGETHWWHSPIRAVVAVRTITRALTKADPAGSPYYRRRAADYIAQLRRLDREIARCIRSVPADDRELVTTHDSFGAFADRYRVRRAGTVLPGQSTQAQPSVGEIAELAAELRQDEVGAVFPEPGADPGLEQALAAEAGAVLGEPLWGDSLGPPGSSGATYLDAMSSNTAAMVEGFTGGARSCEPTH